MWTSAFIGIYWELFCWAASLLSVLFTNYLTHPSHWQVQTRIQIFLYFYLMSTLQIHTFHYIPLQVSFEAMPAFIHYVRRSFSTSLALYCLKSLKTHYTSSLNLWKNFNDNNFMGWQLTIMNMTILINSTWQSMLILMTHHQHEVHCLPPRFWQ